MTDMPILTAAEYAEASIRATEGTDAMNAQHILVTHTNEPDPDDLFTDDRWECHHDYLGWYLVAPDELRDEGGYGPDGVSLGFDGRPHFETEEATWAYASEHGFQDSAP